MQVLRPMCEVFSLSKIGSVNSQRQGQNLNFLKNSHLTPLKFIHKIGVIISNF